MPPKTSRCTTTLQSPPHPFHWSFQTHQTLQMGKKLFTTLYENENLHIPDHFIESGEEYGERIAFANIECEDLRKLITSCEELSINHLWKWCHHKKQQLSPTTLILNISTINLRATLHRNSPESKECIISQRPLHTTHNLDTYLSDANKLLKDKGYFFCNCRTSGVKKQIIYNKYPIGLRTIIYFGHYLWHRVSPKVYPFNKLYFLLTKGKNRIFNRVEILGRLYHAGFEVVYEGTSQGTFFAIGRKVRQPITVGTPSISPIIRLRRVGHHGKIIEVYKFRTMYSYSEYIQSYVYDHNQLDESGKFANDYRISTTGKWLRRLWLDELPMIVNLLKGEMKLVGVRPLSEHYLSLYTPEMQKLHISVKPGLLPPFYYEKHTPSTPEEVQESERRYIESYHKRPLYTDWRYFWGIVRNILFNRKRSH